MKFSKVFLIIAMTLLMISTLIACRSDNDSNFIGELDYTSNGDGTCVVSGIGTYNSEKINIPSTSPTGDTVVGIGQDAFRWCYNIKEVTLPDGVINIGAYVKGSNKDIDLAVSKIDSINRFLRQKTEENISFEETIRMMEEIAGVSE